MDNKKINARLAPKHDIEANWLKATKFIPLEGEIIIYCKEEEGDILPEGRSNLIKYDRIKIGDGVSNVNDLPFLKAESDVIEKSAEGGYTFGKEEDNLETISEHSALFGKNIKAGVRGLKIVSTEINKEAKTISIITEENAEELYTAEVGYTAGTTRAALILAHHSFESFKVDEIIENTILVSAINPNMVFTPEYYELHVDNIARNYLWLYNVDNSDEDMPRYDVSININCPIRKEVDYVYALGNEINAVGRSSFSSGGFNQNIGWYSATLGLDNLAYYAGFAFGGGNKALGTYSTAMNQITTATATGSSAKGYKTKATANYAEAGGQQTEANHKASFTHGLGTKSGRQHQAVVGEYNEESKTALFVVGNGSASTSSNSLTITEIGTYNIHPNIIKNSFNIVSDEVNVGATVIEEDGTFKLWEIDNSVTDHTEFELIECGRIDYLNNQITVTYIPHLWTDRDSILVSYNYNIYNRSNALEIEKDGSATIGKTGAKENSVATKGYVDAAKAEAENNVDEAIDAANKSYFVENYAQIEKCELNTLHNDIIIKDNVITCTSNTLDFRNQYRAQVSNIYADKYQGLNYELKFKINEFKEDITHDGLWFKFVDFSGDNIPNGAEGLGLVVRSTNCLFAYITEDSFNYDNTSLGVKTFNIPLNTTDEFKLNARLESNKIIIKFTNLATNREYGEYEYPLTETCTITPSLAIGFRFVKAEVEYNIYSDEYVLLARKNDVNQALANAKSYTDEKFAGCVDSGKVISEIEKEIVLEHIDFSTITTFDLGYTDIVPGTVNIRTETLTPITDSGNGVLYTPGSGRVDMNINYKTGTIFNIPNSKLSVYTDCTISFKYYNFNETNIPSTKLLNNYVNNQILSYFDKFNNYIIHDNNYIYLETPTIDNEVYGYAWYNLSASNVHFSITKAGFENAAFNESFNGEDRGANPTNNVNRYITFTNNYENAYEDFLMKIDIELKDIYASQTGLKGATGPIIFPFENAAGIQFRQNGSIVCSYGGTTTVITNNQINKIGKYTIYFKYMKALGILNIYKDSLDNLLTSIQLTDTERANMKPQLAFGGRCCTYSAECEIHKAELELKPIKRADYELILNKDPYKYYMIEE